MKSLTAKMLMSLAIVGIAALLLTAAVFVGGRAIASAQNAHDDLLIVALALGGATASMTGGFKRKQGVGETKHFRVLVSSEARNADATSANSSMFHLGA